VGINQRTLEIKIALLGNLESLVEGVSLSNLMIAEKPKTVIHAIAKPEPDLETVEQNFEQAIIAATELEKLGLGAEEIKAEDSKVDKGATTTAVSKLPILYYRWNG